MKKNHADFRQLLAFLGTLIAIKGIGSSRLNSEHRRKIILIEGNAKCRNLKILVSVPVALSSMVNNCPASPEKEDPSTRELLRRADSTGPVSPICT